MSVSFGTPEHMDGSNTTLTKAFTVENVGGDRMLIVVQSRDGGSGGGGLGATYGGVAMTHLGATVSNGDNALDVWYLKDPAVGTANIVTTVPGSAPTAHVWLAVVAMGVDLSSPWGATATANGSGGGFQAISATIAADVSQTVIAAVSGDTDDTAGLTPMAGQTQIDEWWHNSGLPANNTVAGLSYEQGAPSVTSGYNFGGTGNHELIVAAIKASTAPRGRLADYYVGFWDPELVLTNNEGAIVPANEVNADTWLYTRGLDMGHPVIYDSFVDDPSKSRIVEAVDTAGRLDLKANKSQFARIIIERAREGV